MAYNYNINDFPGRNCPDGNMQQFNAPSFYMRGQDSSQSHLNDDTLRPQHSFENIPQQNQFNASTNNQARNNYPPNHYGNLSQNCNPDSYSYSNTPNPTYYQSTNTQNAFHPNNAQGFGRSSFHNDSQRESILPQIPFQGCPPNYGVPPSNFPPSTPNFALPPPPFIGNNSPFRLPSRPNWNTSINVEGNAENQAYSAPQQEFIYKTEEINSRNKLIEDINEITDVGWLQNWINNTEIRIKNEKKNREKPCKFKISDVQEKLLKYSLLIKEMEDVIEEISLWDKCDHHSYDLLKKKAIFLKDEINELKKFFGSENQQLIQEMFRERREKRLRSRKTKTMKAENKKQWKQKWKEEETKIDQRLHQLHQEEKAKVEELKMKKEADTVLREVRTKQEEAQKMEKLLAALSQLREARMKKGEVHGYVPSAQANVFFDKLQDEFNSLITNQLHLYRSEEQTLKVMMEESKNPFSVSSKSGLTNCTSNVENVQNEIYEILFGEKSFHFPDQYDESQRSSLLAEESLETLVNRRTDWDKFVCAENTPLSSSIPVNWVVPVTDPRPDWKRFQHK